MAEASSWGVAVAVRKRKSVPRRNQIHDSSFESEVGTQHVEPELKRPVCSEDFFEMYVRVIEAFTSLGAPDHATPENVREITKYLLKRSFDADRPPELEAAGLPWTPAEDETLIDEYGKGCEMSRY
jgi:hypothetical protein